MLPTCFQLYFQPVYSYVKKGLELATDNNFTLTFTTSLLVGISQALKVLFEIEIFGLSNYLLLLVVGTILLDAYYGVRRSLKESKEAFAKAAIYTVDQPEFKRWMKVHKLKKFKPEKLQFTFFKVLTLLGYLFFAKQLLVADVDGFFGIVLGFSSSVILKLPLAIFWYYDFKSIGDNAAYIHGKKAPIFKIVESIFELRIKNFLNYKNDKKNGL